MNLNERIKEIDKFFSKLTVEEFEDMLDKCGINEIESSKDQGRDLSLNVAKYINDKK